MGYLPHWLGLAPQVMTVALAVFVPGYLVLRCARFDRLFAAIVGPAWTLLLAGGSGILFQWASVPWNLWTFAGFVTLVALVAFLLRRVVPPSWTHTPRVFSSMSRTYRVAGLVMTVASWAIAILPVLRLIDPVVPHMQADPMYHYNGVNAILHTGNASLFGAMDMNYGLRVRSIVYPSTWHAIVSLVASEATIVTVSHILVFVIVPIVWLSGLMFLARVTFPTRIHAVLIVPIVSILFPAFPNFLSVETGFWPNSLALAVLPSILGVLVVGWREFDNQHHVGQLAAAGFVFLGALLGATLAHPSILFTIVLISVPTGLALAIRLNRQVMASNASTLAKVAVMGLSIAVVGALIAILQLPRVQAYLSRGVESEFTDVPRRIMSSIMIWPAGTNVTLNAGLTIVVGTCVAIGIVAAIRHRRARWLVYSWCVQWLLILGSLLPLGIISSIAGLWYHDTYRLFAVQAVFTTLLVALGIDQVVGKATAHIQSSRPRFPVTLGRTVDAVGALVLGLAFGAGAIFLQKSSVFPAARPSIGEGRILGSSEEFQLIQDLSTKVEPGSIIVGDPMSGIGYGPVVGDVISVYTQVNQRDLDVDGNYLAQHFSEIHSDPAVCDIIDYYNIDYFYADSTITYHGSNRASVMPGFYNVDTSEGFERVAEGGSATLWKITACGPRNTDMNWWEMEDRFTPVLNGPTGVQDEGGEN